MMGAETRLQAAAPAKPIDAELFEASQDCVKLVDLDGRLLAMNANGVCLMEIDDFTALQGLHWSSLWPVELRSLVDAAVASAQSGSVARFSADCPTAKGTMRSWDVVVSPVFNAKGAVDQILSVSQDVTEKKRLADDNALLTRELAHRIANVFAVVDGVIALSAREQPTVRHFSDDLRRRLRDIGRATAFVSPILPGFDRPSSSATLLGLLKLLLEPYGATGGGEAARIAISGEDAFVGPRATTSLAMVANELATNALKYGALSHVDGLVAVSVARRGDAVRLSWSERGGPRVAEPLGAQGGGFGRTLLDNAVVRQLGGSLVRAWPAEGLSVEMTLPLASLAD